MSDFPSDLNALRSAVVEARDSAARRGVEQLSANSREAMTSLDAALAEHRRLEEIDRILAQADEHGERHGTEAEIQFAEATVVKPHARSFGGDVPADTPRIDTV